jgi:hypothetical protein
LFSSTNLTTWTQRSAQFGTNNTARAAAFGNGIFVVVGGGSNTSGNNISWSTNGTSWNQASNINGLDSGTTFTDFTSLVFADGRFVATHGGANTERRSFITSSTDGNTWTAISFGRASSGQVSISHITHLNGIYAASGTGWMGGTVVSTEPFIAFSLDAINWVTKPISFLKYTFESQPGFVITTNGTSILISPFGSTEFPIMVLEPAPIAITPIGA